MIVLDTNVLSESLKPSPSRLVLEWLGAQPASNLFTTAITRAELLYGLALLPSGQRRRTLESRIEQILDRGFAGRIPPFDAEAAQAYAEIYAARRMQGRPMPMMDAQIAAIALAHG